jgi:PAS domain S-box-containing protein
MALQRRQRRASEQCSESEEILGSIVDDIPVGILVVDRDSRVRLWNARLEAETHRPRREVLGRNVFELFSGQVQASLEQTLRSVLRTGKREVLANHFIDDPALVSKPSYVSIKVNPLKDDSGQVNAVVVAVEDVTERACAEAGLRRTHAEQEQLVAERTAELAMLNEQLRQEVAERTRAEDELARVAEHLSLLLESTGEGIYGVDLDGRCTFINKSAANMLGCAPEQLLGKPMHESVTHSRADGAPYPVEDCPVMRTCRTGQGRLVDHETFWRPDGASFPVQYSSYPLIRAGATEGAVVVFGDITERRRAESEREELLARLGEINHRLALASARYQVLAGERQRRVAELDATINAIADGVVIYNPEGHIIRMNKAAERILCCVPEQLDLPLAERLSLLGAKTVAGESIPVEAMPPMRALRGETVLGEALVFQAPNEKPLCISTSAAPVRSAAGQLLGAVLSLSDITRVHELQEQREDFIRTISHDLRGPLTTISGHAQILNRIMASASATDSERYSVEAIMTASRRLNSMIQDLVDSARLEAGRLDQQFQPLDMCSFLDELVRRAYTSLDANRLKLSTAPESLTVVADPGHIERIVVNLCSNALKYSQPNSDVTVTIECVGQEARVSVTDRGMGIAPEDLPHIFERFYQTHGPRKKESVGLGLYITRMLVEAHGGRIWVESQVGRGSVFYFTLPLA